MNEPDPVSRLLDELSDSPGNDEPADGSSRHGSPDDGGPGDDPDTLVAAALRILERSELGYPQAFRRVSVALLLSDAHGRVDEANAAMGRALDRAPAALETRDLSLLLHPGDRGGLRSGLATLAQLSAGGSTSLDVRLLPRGGESIRARARAVVLGSGARLLWEFRSPSDRPLRAPDAAVEEGGRAGGDAPAAGTVSDDVPDLLPPPRSLRILVLARQRAVAEAIAAYLRPLECAEEVVHATDAATALRTVGRRAVDLVVVSLRVADHDPVAFAREAREASPETRLVVTGIAEDDDAVLELVEEGVDGFLFEGGSLSDLAATVNAAARDELALPPRVTARLAARLSKMSGILRARAYDPDAYEALTPREREVLEHLAEGRTNREIARRLGIQVGTVKTHVHHVLTKLDLQGREQAADYLSVARSRSDEQSRK